jgi:hypothetical protein
MKRLSLFFLLLLPGSAVAADCAHTTGGTNVSNMEKQCNCPGFSTGTTDSCSCNVCQAGTSSQPNGVCNDPIVPYPVADAYLGTWTMQHWKPNEDCAGPTQRTVIVNPTGCTAWLKLTQPNPYEASTTHWVKGSCDPTTGYSVFHFFDNENCAGTAFDVRGINQFWNQYTANWAQMGCAQHSGVLSSLWKLYRFNNTHCESGNGQSSKTTCTIASSGTSPTPGSNTGTSPSPDSKPGKTGVAPSPQSTSANSNVQGGSSTLCLTAIHFGLVAMVVFAL